MCQVATTEGHYFSGCSSVQRQTLDVESILCFSEHWIFRARMHTKLLWRLYCLRRHSLGHFDWTDCLYFYCLLSPFFQTTQRIVAAGLPVRDNFARWVSLRTVSLRHSFFSGAIPLPFSLLLFSCRSFSPAHPNWFTLWCPVEHTHTTVSRVCVHMCLLAIQLQHFTPTLHSSSRKNRKNISAIYIYAVHYVTK